jgi:hypothetical protein
MDPPENPPLPAKHYASGHISLFDLTFLPLSSIYTSTMWFSELEDARNKKLPNFSNSALQKMHEPSPMKKCLFSLGMDFLRNQVSISTSNFT